MVSDGLSPIICSLANKPFMSKIKEFDGYNLMENDLKFTDYIKASVLVSKSHSQVQTIIQASSEIMIRICI